jgi:hypothetical protein
MSEDRVAELAQVVVDLVHKVNLLAAKLNVALELLAEARLTGEPDNQQLIAEKLAAAEAAVRANLMPGGFAVAGVVSGAPTSSAAARTLTMGVGGTPLPAAQPMFTADEDEPTSGGRPIPAAATAPTVTTTTAPTVTTTVTERVVETIVHPDGRREVIERVITHDPRELAGALDSARREGTAQAALGVLQQLGQRK